MLRAVIVGLKAINNQPVQVWKPPLLLVLAGMLREGVLAVLPAFLARLWIARRERRAWLWTATAAVTGVKAADLPTLANYGPDLARTRRHRTRPRPRRHPAEYRTVALHDAGAIPYYSHWRTIDIIGLNDEPIPRSQRHRSRHRRPPHRHRPPQPRAPPGTNAYGVDFVRITAG